MYCTDFSWENFLDILKADISGLSYSNWISPLELQELNGSVLYISSPSTFIKNWIDINFSTILLKAAKQCCEQIETVQIVVVTQKQENNDQSSITKVNLQQLEEKIISDNSSTFDIPLNPNYTFENFVVGKPNMFAFNAAKSIAEGATNFNPLFIHGGVGLGKTHLMHSIAWSLKKTNPKIRFLYLTAEKFMNLFVIALKDHNILSFKEMFRATDLLMIDDFQFMSGKDQTQEEFFHTFNSLISQQKQIVISADKSPHLLTSIAERIRSRLHAGLTIDIHETNYELRLGILQSKAKLLNIKLPKNVTEFLAHTITSNVRELEGCFNKLISYHRVMNVDITLDLAVELLSDAIKHSNQHIEVEMIQKKVAEQYKIKFVDLISAKKDKQTVLARHVAAYISKQLTKLSLAEIGKKFGGRDHATIIYSINKIEKTMALDSNLEHDIKLLMKSIQQSE